MHQDPETPQRLRQNCVWVSPEEVQASSGLPQGQGLWVQQTWVWQKSSWRRSPLTHHRAARTYTGLGKQTLGGHRWNLEHTRTQEKGAVTLQKTDQDLAMSLWWRYGLVVACCGIGGSKCSSACMGPFEGGHHYLHYLHHSLASGQTTGREHSPAHQQKIGLKIY